MSGSSFDQKLDCFIYLPWVGHLLVGNHVGGEGISFGGFWALQIANQRYPRRDGALDLTKTLAQLL